MKRLSILCLVLLVASLAYPAYERWKTGAMMVDTARAFLAALTPEQRAKATFAYTDPERQNWHFIPRERKGISFKELTPAQNRLAHAFLASGLSRRGYIQAATIMSLEQVLLELEQGAVTRDPELYYFTLFGEPSLVSRWGWRVEGHHLSVNFVVDKGQVLSTTPSFFGANPARVEAGPRQGLRALAEEEDLARELLKSLDEKQRARAIFQAAAPRDIITGASRKAEIGAPVGLPVSAMNARQRELLMSLLNVYTGRMPPDPAESRMEELRKAGLDRIHFAWAGGSEPGQGHYYRLQGPTFLVEYDDTQNNANHIHTVWRDLRGDFGPDLLALHYRQSHHGRAWVARSAAGR